MKKAILLIAFFILGNLFSLFIGYTNSDTSKRATVEELSQMNKDFVKELNAKDITQLVKSHFS